MKGVLKPDHIAVNNFELLVLGMPALTVLEVKGLDDELQKTELPDRTMASGGNRKATEFTMKLPMHHLVEQAAMEIWFREGQDPVLPTYKKAATLIHKSISGQVLRTYSMIGIFPFKRTLPDLEMKNDGEMATTEWSMSVDDVLPI
jgi:hypothetical protein